MSPFETPPPDTPAPGAPASSTPAPPPTPAPAPMAPAGGAKSRTAVIVIIAVIVVLACCALATFAAVLGARIASESYSETLEEILVEPGMPAAVEASVEEGPYPPLLTKRVDAVPPSPDQQLWALATCAILTEFNQGSHSLLGGRIPTLEVERTQQELLADWWGVHGREDLLETLSWIEEGGHRKEFDQGAEFIAGLSEAELADLLSRAADDPTLANQIEVIRTYAPRFGERSIVAWDFDRYVALCGWGYAAGYVTEGEAWELIMPAARVLQQTFDSWDELGENHVVGRTFWSHQETQRTGLQMQAAFDYLSSDPESPWNRISWDLDLGPNEQ